MKKYALFALLVGALTLTGCATLSQNESSTNTTGNPKVASEDYSFDLNVNTLSYQLPSYTKLCTPKSRYNCSAEGCEKGKPVVFVLYDENANKVYRCDNKPCDGYDVTEDISGLYTNLTPVAPNGSLVKLSTDNEYVETVSMGLDFIIYRGSCTDKNNL